VTRTSQVSHQANLLLLPGVPLASNKYRSTNDLSLQEAARKPTQYRLIDTPGHGKLRAEQALSYLKEPSLSGIIYVVDAASLGSGDTAPSRDAAAYLHDVLLVLQRKRTGKGSNKAKAPIPILIAANKQDLFTALPPGAVREHLETEIERARQSKSKGLVDVGNSREDDDEENVLGGGGEEKFTFKMLEEGYGIQVEVTGGVVRGEEAGKGVERWERWIGGCL
jgi:signal recognition particle receptor subunit beta